ncbi:MAG: aspartate/glutamate racemase family protein [Candidatus Uhrbacteria bacterium]|nr:aspartate/glutamate racemase family protein [Candidatus Uhrbacteria bacterium]
MIGIFDSGMGGLTVAMAIRERAPLADFVYFADLANMPFGEKSEEELLHITKHAIQFLMDHGATEIVAACNSVSMLASGLRSEIHIPIMEMSEPTVCALAQDHPQPLLVKEESLPSILVVATEATVRSGMYARAFAAQGIKIESMAIPVLASAIERDASRMELREIILPAVKYAITMNAKTLVLGCTQYPFARSLFEEMFFEQNYFIEVFDPADAVAEEVVSQFDVRGRGEQTFFVSKSSEVFDRSVREFFSSKSLISIP